MNTNVTLCVEDGVPYTPVLLPTRCHVVYTPLMSLQVQNRRFCYNCRRTYHTHGHVTLDCYAESLTNSLSRTATIPPGIPLKIIFNQVCDTERRPIL